MYQPSPRPTETDPRAHLEIKDGTATLTVTYEGEAVLEGISLGVVVNGADLCTGVTLLRSESTDIAGSWYATSGKATGRRRYTHRQTVHHLRHGSGVEWQLHVREAADGVAFRYAVENLWGHARLTGDRTSFPTAGWDRAWVLDYQTWYETPRYGIGLADAEVEAGFPTLLRRTGSDDVHALLTESDIDGRFTGAHLRLSPGTAAVTLADADIEVTRGPVTPWRVVILGDLATVVESQLVDELAPDPLPQYADSSWVRPGRAAWSWWSDFYSGAQIEHQRRFVDAAARLGWEHLLIDCGWDSTWVPDIVAHASRVGVQVHLWAVWHDLDGPQGLANLALWRSWGVAGIKVDFMESESKDRYRWYDTILAETARLGLMVNFHGSVIPRGWARTWPQVIGYEGIRGSEYYVFYQDTPLTAAHNVIQPFTRNVVGAMDYTPVAFGAPDRETSDGHELALAVAFECGITNFADDVDAYLSRPDAATLLSEMPATWDETLLLAGTPDTEAVMARRSGDRWFLGAIATGEARTLEVPLDRLGDGTWQAWVTTDAAGGGLTSSTAPCAGTLTVDVAQHGGFAAILAPAGTAVLRAVPTTPRTPVTVEPAVQLLDTDGHATLRTGPDHHLRLAPGWSATETSPGTWEVQAPHGLPQGHVGVVTVERHDEHPVPTTAPARLVVPFRDLTLTAAPVIAFANESGPVERNMSNGEGNPHDGKQMSIAGVEHSGGFGVSSPSTISIFLGGISRRFTVTVGIDDETPGTQATAHVVADGRELAAVALTAGQLAADIDVDLTDVERLELVTKPVGSSTAHVDWTSGILEAPALTSDHS